MSNGYYINAGAAIGLIVAIVFALGALRLRWTLVRILCGLGMIPALVVAGVFFWYGHRPLPEPAQQQLFQGIEYVRDVRNTPRPLVIHVVRIDLDTPGLRFLVTPGGEDIPASTTSQFLETYDLQLAVNGDYFLPWRDVLPWDFYPHVGDPVSTRGLAASEGAVLTEGFAESSDTLYIFADNQATFNTPLGDIYNAVSGNPFLLLEGNSLVLEGDPEYFEEPHPRTAAGLDESGRMLILMIVDGRQPGFSEGVTLAELTDLMAEFGAYHAINLDGGGSSTLVIEAADGTAQVLNSPIHGRIPGQERPVANHLGMYATR